VDGTHDDNLCKVCFDKTIDCGILTASDSHLYLTISYHAIS
jgi:hypothetical protein